MRNSLAIPLVSQAYKLHTLLFNCMYAYPFKIDIKKGKMSVSVDKILQLKYIPFLLFLIVVTTIIGLGSCFILIFIKLFRPEANVTVIGLFMCIFLGSCALFEVGTYVTYSKATEIENGLNQLFVMERNRKIYIIS